VKRPNSLINLYLKFNRLLIAVNSILYLEYLAENGLVDSLKQAQSNGVDVMILYSEAQNEEAKTWQILSTIKNYAQIKCISGIYGTIFLIDDSKVLTIAIAANILSARLIIRSILFCRVWLCLLLENVRYQKIRLENSFSCKTLTPINENSVSR
jgi:preprotein translocase subunit YajC